MPRPACAPPATRYCLSDTPLGTVMLSGQQGVLGGLHFTGHLRSPVPPANWELDESLFGQPRQQLGEYFDGRRTCFDLHLAPVGSDFAHAVWDALLTIPYGDTVSYGDIARRVGRPGAARAVGAAIGRNPVAVIVPCHRVIGSDGRLTGYAWGVERKAWLLDHEHRTAASRHRR